MKELNNVFEARTFVHNISDHVTTYEKLKKDLAQFQVYVNDSMLNL